MEFTVFHGTIRYYADMIDASKHFRPSTGRTTYLGEGRYFYFQKEESLRRARITANNPGIREVIELEIGEKRRIHRMLEPVVFRVQFTCPDSEVLDLRNKSESSIFSSIADALRAVANNEGYREIYDSDPIITAIHRQSKVCNILWSQAAYLLQRKISVMIGRLPVPPRNETLMGIWHKRDELCLSDAFSITKSNGVVNRIIGG